MDDMTWFMLGYKMGRKHVGKAKAKTITKNGAYAITDEEKSEGYVGYSPLKVNVPTGANIIPLTITVPGTYNAADYGCDGFNPVVSDGSGGGSGGSFCYEDDDVFVFVYDYYHTITKYQPSLENDPNYPKFVLTAYVIYKCTEEVKRLGFGGTDVTIGNGEYTPSVEIPVGAYPILSLSEWKISDINTRRIVDESYSKNFKIEVSITCEASGIADYSYFDSNGNMNNRLGSFTYKGTRTATNNYWVTDENA